MIVTSKQAWEKSEGAFDITIGPLSRLWRQARKENRFPSEKEIRTAREATGFDVLIKY
ncbi:MAG: FAD:protein FMN transferase [Bacteroidota bacterium]